MIRGSLGRWFRRPPMASRIAVGRAVYAIGDIHGRFDLLTCLLAQVSADVANHPSDYERHLVFLGDYIDRGPESFKVIEELCSLTLPGFTPFFLLGNHEDA